MVHICHGWDGVGIGVRGAAAFWLWNQVQVSHCRQLLLWLCLCPARRHIHAWTTGLWWFLDGTGGVAVVSSPFLMEGHWGLFHVGQGHLQQWGSPDVASMGIMGEELPWCCSANQWWSHLWGCTSQGHSERLVGMLPSSLGTGGHGGWQCPVGCLVQDVDWTKRVCQAGPFPYQGSNGWCNCSPGGAVACAADGLPYLPDSSGRWIPGAYGLTQWWKTYHRHMFGISPLWRWQLASLSLYVSILAFGFGKGLAGKSHGFVISEEHCTKAYLWGIDLYCHGK